MLLMFYRPGLELDVCIIIMTVFRIPIIIRLLVYIASGISLMHIIWTKLKLDISMFDVTFS